MTADDNNLEYYIPEYFNGPNILQWHIEYNQHGTISGELLEVTIFRVELNIWLQMYSI
jgi:hypothetical protein